MYGVFYSVSFVLHGGTVFFCRKRVISSFPPSLYYLRTNTWKYTPNICNPLKNSRDNVVRSDKQTKINVHNMLHKYYTYILRVTSVSCKKYGRRERGGFVCCFFFYIIPSFRPRQRNESHTITTRLQLRLDFRKFNTFALSNGPRTDCIKISFSNDFRARFEYDFTENATKTRKRCLVAFTRHDLWLYQLLYFCDYNLGYWMYTIDKIIILFRPGF